MPTAHRASSPPTTMLCQLRCLSSIRLLAKVISSQVLRDNSLNFISPHWLLLELGNFVEHGNDAAGVARANARNAAVTGAIVSAKRWMGVLAAIQRKQAGREAAQRADRGEIS